MTVLITLSGVGSSAGPTFNLYASPDGITFTTIIEGINKTVLEAGYTATVPNGTTDIKVTSVGSCTNSYVATIGIIPTTTTTTTAIPTILICNQNWTTKNLDVTTYSDDTVIPQVTDPNEWYNLTTGAWCYYNNDPLNGAIYGKLYNWYAVAGIYDAASEADPTLRKSLAPTGYHVSSGAEMQTLTMCLDGETIYGYIYSGGRMKEPGTSLWNSPNEVLTPYSGFAALPGGYHYDYNALTPSFGMGVWAVFWSSTEYYDPVDDFTYGTAIYILNDSTNCLPDYRDKTYGHSVRLIKD